MMQAPQQADPRSQAAFDMATKQAAGMLTSEQGAEMIISEAKTRGPAVAIVNAVKQALGAVEKSASGSGVQMPPGVIEAAEQAVAQILVAMMAKSGMARDPRALMQQVQQGLAQEVAQEGEEPPGHEPANPAADAAEDMRDPRDAGEQDSGALRRMRQGGM